RPWAFSERCMSPAAERYLLRPLVEAVAAADGHDGGGAKLALLRVFEVWVDWEEGVEGHGWAEKGVWPVRRGRTALPGEGLEGLETEEVDMWRPSAFLLERGSRAALLQQEGWEVWGDERWESYLVKGENKDKDNDKRGREGEEVEGDESEDGDGYEEEKGGKLWQDAPFKVIRSFESSDSRRDSW
ncbi:hypothetical protein RJZ57_007617, partial [Blastomyces gilchristii]